MEPLINWQWNGGECASFIPLLKLKCYLVPHFPTKCFSFIFSCTLFNHTFHLYNGNIFHVISHCISDGYFWYGFVNWLFHSSSIHCLVINLQPIFQIKCPLQIDPASAVSHNVERPLLHPGGDRVNCFTHHPCMPPGGQHLELFKDLSNLNSWHPFLICCIKTLS